MKPFKEIWKSDLDLHWNVITSSIVSETARHTGWLISTVQWPDPTNCISSIHINFYSIQKVVNMKVGHRISVSPILVIYIKTNCKCLTNVRLPHIWVIFISCLFQCNSLWPSDATQGHRTGSTLSSDIHLRAVSQEILQSSVTKISFEITQNLIQINVMVFPITLSSSVLWLEANNSHCQASSRPRAWCRVSVLFPNFWFS